MSADPAVPEPDGAAASVHEGAPHDPDAFTCPNCGTPNVGEFCARCGQKRLHDGDLSLRHAWHHVTHEVLHLDGKIFGTLKRLFTKPGQLALDFVEGRRARHVHPVRLFLLFSALFIATTAPGFTLKQMLNRAAPENGNATFNPSAPGMPGLRITGQTDRIEARLRQKAERQGVPYELYVEHLDHRFALALKVGYTLAVAANGLWFALLFRGRFRYLAEHMVFALYVSCFVMAVNTLGGRLNDWVLGRTVLVAATLSLSLFIYKVLAVRRVYRSAWLPAVLKLILVDIVAALILYGFVAAVFLAAVR